MQKGQHESKQIAIRDMVIFIMVKWLQCGRAYNPILLLPDLAKRFEVSETTMRAWIKEAKAAGILPEIKETK
jgi:hypothetical protein